MPHVAFFRNLNQGQRASPTSEQLRVAFLRSGAEEARLVQSNGTVVFRAADPQGCLGATVDELVASSAWNDIALLRAIDWIAALLERLPELDAATRARTELSLFGPELDLAADAPVVGHRTRIILAGRGFAVTVNERDRESNATPTLERFLETPVTSRSLRTIRRLVDDAG